MKLTLWHVALLGTAFILYFWGLGELPFYDQGEPREGLQVIEAIDQGEWLLPLRNGVELPSKPPLFHWFGGLVAVLLGRVDELTLRLPSALVATAILLAISWFGARRWSVEAGLYAAFILATSFEWIRAARSARVDMLLTGCLTSAFLALEIIARASVPSPVALAVFYVSIGLAVLTKGPVGLVLPVLLAVAYLAARRDLGRIHSMHPVIGGAVVLLISGWWYFMAALTRGDAFVRKQLLGENVARFLTGADAFDVAVQPRPVYYYLTHLFADFAPWCFLLVPLGLYLHHIRRRPEVSQYVFPLIWFTVIVVFYSIAAGKRSRYILSAYPAAALLLGIWWSQLSQQSISLPSAARWILYGMVAAGLGIIPILLFVLFAEALGGNPLEWIRPFLHHKDQANLPLVRDIIRSHLVGWIAVVAAFALPLISGVWLRRWPFVFASLVAFVTSMTLMIHSVFHPEIARRQTFKPFMATVRNVVTETDALAFYNQFDYGAVFYARRRIPDLNGTLPSTPSEHTLYVLVWEKDWQVLTPAERERLQLLERSEGTGPFRNNPLLLTVMR